MGRHVVIGAGAVGRATVASLSSRGIDAQVVTRSGVHVPGARSEAVDALDTDRLAAAIAAGPNFVPVRKLTVASKGTGTTTTAASSTVEGRP